MPKKETRATRICKKFKAAQVELDYTQDYIAEQLGVSQGSISSWINNADMMSVGHFRLLCKVLELDPAEIMSIQ